WSDDWFVGANYSHMDTYLIAIMKGNKSRKSDMDVLNKNLKKEFYPFKNPARFLRYIGSKIGGDFGARAAQRTIISVKSILKK
ncbi:MAG: hypothetical protein AAFR17_19470, partial [Pseudomonadota bacterium]